MTSSILLAVAGGLAAGMVVSWLLVGVAGGVGCAPLKEMLPALPGEAL